MHGVGAGFEALFSRGGKEIRSRLLRTRCSSKRGHSLQFFCSFTNVDLRLRADARIRLPAHRRRRDCLVLSFCSGAPRDYSGERCELPLALGCCCCSSWRSLVLARALLDPIVADMARDCFGYFICLWQRFFRGLPRELLPGSCGLMRRWARITGWCGRARTPLVRNPIYTSMLLVLCAIAVIIAGWKLFAAALVLFVIGTEIRVRIEERLLASRFGEEFEAYKRSIPAYLPFSVEKSFCPIISATASQRFPRSAGHRSGRPACASELHPRLRLSRLRSALAPASIPETQWYRRLGRPPDMSVPGSARTASEISGKNTDHHAIDEPLAKELSPCSWRRSA